MKTIRSALLVCLAVLLMSLAVVPAAQGAGAGSPTVIVGTTNDLYAPFEYPIAGGAKNIGFDHDLVVAIAKDAGLNVAFRTFAWGYIATYPGPWADCDMVAAAVTPWPPRRAFMRFSDLYFNEDPHGPLAYAFPKTQEGAALCAQVNAALQQVKDDGTWAQIYRKWFGVAPTTIHDPLLGAMRSRGRRLRPPAPHGNLNAGTREARRSTAGPLVASLPASRPGRPTEPVLTSRDLGVSAVNQSHEHEAPLRHLE